MHWGRGETEAHLHERTAGIHLRAYPNDMRVLDDGDPQCRANLIAGRLQEWKAIANN